MLRLIFILLVVTCKTGYSQTDTLRYGTVGYFLKQAINFESRKEYDKAIAFTDTALRIAPTNKNVFAVKAEILWMMKRFSEAADNYQKALLLDKDSSYLFSAYLFLGVLYEKANKPVQAQSQYLKAVYFFENKKKKNDRFFANLNKIDYALALKLSGNDEAWGKLLNDPFYNVVLLFISVRAENRFWKFTSTRSAAANSSFAIGWPTEEQSATNR